MADLYHYFGNDLMLGPTGDLLLASDVQLVQQRVIRRLMTNAGDYLWHLTYGAGLPAQIGEDINVAAITNIVLSQIFVEPSVARVPEPTVSVTANGSTVTCSIVYTDAPTGTEQTLTFPVS